MKYIVLTLAGLLWLVPVQAKKLRTPKSPNAAAHRSATPRGKRIKAKKINAARAKTKGN